MSARKRRRGGLCIEIERHESRLHDIHEEFGKSYSLGNTIEE